MTGRQRFESGYGGAGCEYQIETLHELAQVRSQYASALRQLVQRIRIQGFANSRLRRKVGVGQCLLLFI